MSTRAEVPRGLTDYEVTELSAILPQLPPHFYLVLKQIPRFFRYLYNDITKGKLEQCLFDS